MAHTIVLFQPGNVETRTYWDFESLNDALECKYNLLNDQFI